MKNIANTLSLSRMFLAVLLFGFLDNKLVFVILYMACGISDILDGVIARSTHTESDFGAKLDSVADFFMFGVIVVYVMLKARGLEHFEALLWLVGLIVCSRMINIIIAAYKYHRWITIHTWGNKITGLLVFMIPILLMVTENSLFYFLIGFCAFLAAVEEGMIHITSKEPDLNRRSIFLK